MQPQVIQKLKAQLVHAVTAYDRRQSTKRNYNPYALPQYFARIEEVLTDIEHGADVAAALAAGFNGPLQKCVCKAAGVEVNVDASAAWHYVPMTARKG